MDAPKEVENSKANENWLKRLWKRTFPQKGNEIGNDDTDLLEPLLPNEDPDNYEYYARAFETIVKKDVSSVAITGPYGAGKTSLIGKFRRNHPDLNIISISLATFEDDKARRKIDPDEIQQSILQQLIYSASEDELEYSRFKRIRKPKRLWWKAVALGAFAILTGAAIIFRKQIEKFVTEAERFWEYVITAVFAIAWAALLIVIIRGILKASVGLSIRKFSLKNAEIETDQQSQESVFNKNLDEIIYFFQEVPCDILVIEDLDRFEKTEIYTKICEINRLVNENKTIKSVRSKPIVFLFAIRDELFEGDERTKIFDLLIPVIPFVSAGNAYSVLHNKLLEAGLRAPLNTRFLREVAVYVTDHRYLVNIVNEYVVYCRNLLESNLDPNKLFAVILYKVFCPRDFGKLHKSEGTLAELVKELDKQRSEKRDEFNAELKILEEAERELREGKIANREALANAYVGAMVRRYGRGSSSFLRPDTRVQQQFNVDAETIFEVWNANSNVQILNVHNQNLGTIQKSEIERIVHPGLTLSQRLAEIERIERLSGEVLQIKRDEVAKKIRDIRFLPMKDAFSVEELREKSANLEPAGLFVYLVNKGYLGEDFDEYTSYFHPGATTRADLEFVRRFHLGLEMDFNERVDTPSEVLLILDDGLFGKPQGFNLTLVDYVLKNPNRTQRDRLVKGLEGFPEYAFRFLEIYYNEGNHSKTLVRSLVKGWQGFLDDAVGCINPLPHVQAVLKNATDETVKKLRASDGILQFIERFAPDVFDSPKLAERLPLLGESEIAMNDVGFSKLRNNSKTTAIRNTADFSLWKITPRNIAVLLNWQGIEEKTARTSMFQSLEKASDSIYQHVETNINTFVENCFLEVEATIAEPKESLERLLSVDGLKEELGERIINRQEARVWFGKVPEHYRSALIEHEKYAIDWKNFEELLQASEDFDAVAPVFVSSNTVDGLSKSDNVSEDLFGYLVDCQNIPLKNYQKLIGPKLGKISELPASIDSSKKLHLITSGMVALDEDAYNWLSGSVELRVALFVNQYSTFEGEIEEWSLEEAEVAGLLKSSIPFEGKRRMLQKAGAVDCAEDEELCREVVQILTDPKTKIDEFDEDFVERVIDAATQNDGIELLVRMIPKWDVDRVMSNLEIIGSPYERIAGYRNKPTIDDNTLNLSLAQALDDRGFISQFKRVKGGIKIITKNSEPSE